MIIQQENISDIVNEVIPMLADHWLEAEHNRDELPLNPDWDMYAMLEDQGVYVVVTARFEGELIGYMGDIIHKHLHYSELVSSTDLVFIKPEHRKGVVFKKMVRLMEDLCKRRGVKERFMNMKQPGKGLLGYNQFEIVTRKYLGD